MKRQIQASIASFFLACGLVAALVDAVAASPRPSAQAGIRTVLETQRAAWNRGHLETFMEGYWKSDRTEFVGASGVQHGWQAVLDRYRRSYPDRKAMGQLTFSELEIALLAPDAAYVVGHWQLEREADHPGGVFTLILRKFPEGWRIVHDHTSALAPPAPPRK